MCLYDVWWLPQGDFISLRPMCELSRMSPQFPGLNGKQVHLSEW